MTCAELLHPVSILWCRVTAWVPTPVTRIYIFNAWNQTLTETDLFSDGLDDTGWTAGDCEGNSAATTAIISQQDITVTANTTFNLTVPATANFARIQLTSWEARYRYDNVSPTISNGHKLFAWQSIVLETRGELTNFEWIGLLDGHLTATYYTLASEATD